MSVLRRLPVYGKKPPELKGLLSISPSQIEQGRLCLRRWYRSYVDYFKEPQAPSAAKGDRIHIILQDYLTDGKQPDKSTDEGRIADSGLKHLPQPKTGKCEGGFFMPVNSVWGWIGKVDWEAFDGSLYVDHKTTSDFKWMKSVDTLHKDPQGLLYGLKVIGDKDYQQGRWVYYRTRGAYLSEPVDFSLSRNQIAEGIEELEPEIENLITLRKAKFLDLPPSPDACHAFGRPCPHMDMCTDINGTDIIRGMFMATLSKDELLAKLRTNAVGAPAVPVVTPSATSAPVATPTPQPAPQPAPAGNSLLALLPGAPSPIPTPPAPVTVTPGPEGPVATETPVGANGPAQVPAFEPVTNPGTPEAKRSRGRPPGSKNKPKDIVTSLPNVDSPDGNAILAPAIVGDIQPFGTLYVNCIPMHDEEYTMFPEMCSAGIVVDTRTFAGRDNLSKLIANASAIVMPLP